MPCIGSWMHLFHWQGGTCNRTMLTRQKTVDPKTFCPCYYSKKRIVGGKGRGFWCGSCLYIRMGENIHEVKGRKDWRCPCCRDICNCSGANCLRARRNLAVTNQLIHEATKQGFKSVCFASFSGACKVFVNHCTLRFYITSPGSIPSKLLVVDCVGLILTVNFDTFSVAHVV